MKLSSSSSSFAFALRQLSFWSLFCGLLSLSSAQQTQEGPVGVAVNIKALDLDWGTWGTGYLDMRMHDMHGLQVGDAEAYDGETEQFTVRLEPGKTYWMLIESEDLGVLTIQAVPPPGYVMEIDRVSRERMVLDIGGSTSISLRVVAPYQEYSGRGGTATMLTSGRVLWQASMGFLANGASAGALAIIDTGGDGDLEDLFTPAGLLYEHTSSEVEVVPRPNNHPTFPGAIHQIIAPQVCVDIFLDSSDQAQIKFYHRGQLKSTPSSGAREFNGDPFAWYLINPDGSEPNKIVIDCHLRELASWTSTGDPDYVKSTVLERSGTAPNFTWTADDWYKDGTSPLSRDIRARSSGVESVTVKVPDGATALAGSRTYGSVPWGEETVSETRGTGSTVTTNYSFHTSTEQAGNYGRLKSMTVTGGGWEAYEYYDYSSTTADVAGALHKRHRPFKNSDTSVPSNLSSHQGEITTFEYATDAFGRRTRPTLVETAVNGTVISRTVTGYSEASAGFNGHSLV